MRLYDIDLASRLLLGTAQYPSPKILTEAIAASGCSVVTASLRREGTGSGAATGGAGFWSLLKISGARVLPNTAGCHSAREAVTTARMAREVFGTSWIKLEVIGNADTLQPDPFELVEAARILCSEGFDVFPYTTEDLIVAERLLEAGCQVLMPWGAPIGSGRGLRHVDALASMRAHFPGVPLIIDAGIGAPSQAAQAAGVSRIVYTSLLHADTSPLSLAGEHRDTEAALKAAGLRYTILRNGWYTENYTGSIPAALANGAFVGSAGEGRISSASRADYAQAAAEVVTGEDHDGKVYELAGDSSYTLADLAAELSRQTGKDIPYKDLPEAEYAGILKSVGLPEGLAEAIASWDVGASQGALHDEDKTLSTLIGRPTLSLGDAVAQALRS